VTADALPFKLAEIYADYYNVPRPDVERLVRAGLTTDDVSVICFVAVAGPSPVTTLALQRMRKVSWSDVLVRIGIPGRALVPVTENRIGGARYVRLLRRVAAAPDAPARALDDDQVRDLVQLKVAVEYFGLDPADVAAWRDAGVSSSRILLGYYFAGGGRPNGRKLQRLQGPVRLVQ